MRTRKIRKRVPMMSAFASRNGLKFKERDDMGTLAYLRDFKLFRKGGRKRIYNFCSGTDGLNNETAVFDYQYVVSTGNSASYFRQTVYFRLHKGMTIPKLKLTPQMWYHRIGKAFGLQDIDFTVEPAFSKNYLLQGRDEELVRKQFTSEVIQFFNGRKGWHLEADNYFFILYRKRRLLKDKQLEDLFVNGQKLTELFQAHRLAH